ncbi:hypothetical protein [Telmatospirillum sp.]|uniref:hypothetical protein n=1 Tax=Telmatospirillum sp. TaxID=2079197 RepID=UPI00284FC260|nr:hypothetical protein [Telmatospirillum sp.]MDR3438176.1 hypothetical protein [Telmatospirillum sp.]
MSWENSRLFHGGVSLAILLPLVIASPGVAHAQGYPVIDSAAVAKAVDNLNAAAQQVKELNDMLVQVQSIVQTVGKEGVPTLLFQEALSQSGISQYGPPVKDLLDQANATWGTVQAGYTAGQQTVKSFKDVLTEADKLKGQANALGAKPDFSSFLATQTWVKKELTVAKDANLTAVDLTRKARTMLAGEAAANAYAIALNARQQVSTMADRAQKLAQQANSATDMRSDVAANTAVMLAMHDEMAQVQALLAAVLEVQSSSRLADMDPTVSTSAASGGSASSPATGH